MPDIVDLWDIFVNTILNGYFFLIALIGNFLGISVDDYDTMLTVGSGILIGITILLWLFRTALRFILILVCIGVSIWFVKTQFFV